LPLLPLFFHFTYFLAIEKVSGREVELAAPETPPHPSLKLPKKLEASLPLLSSRLEDENEETPIKRPLRLTGKLKNLSGPRIGLKRAIGAFLMLAMDLSIIIIEQQDDDFMI
jgi:hypothetical protein